MDYEIELDAHHHFWSLGRGDYQWIRQRLHLSNMMRLARDFDIAEYRGVLASHGVRRSLLVQTERTAAETDQMIARAWAADYVAGVVGWVDFRADDAASEVARRASDPTIKGLRLWLLGDQGADWVFGDTAQRGLDSAVSHDLPLELFPDARQVDAVLRLLAERPLPPVAICHAAKPGVGVWDVRDAEFARWRSDMKRLANAGCFVKFSGVVTECGDDWRLDELRPYWDALLAAFGPSRIMWGSDWPVIERAGGFGKWLDAVRALASELTAADRRSIFGGAAQAFYRL